MSQDTELSKIEGELKNYRLYKSILGTVQDSGFGNYVKGFSQEEIARMKEIVMAIDLVYEELNPDAQRFIREKYFSKLAKGTIVLARELNVSTRTLANYRRITLKELAKVI